MIGFSAFVNVDGFNRLLTRLPGELALATQLSADLLRPIAEGNIESLGAIDTGALKESLYVSVKGGSQYAESAAAAAEAYQFNPTAYEGIRAANGGVLDLDPEVTPQTQNQGYLAVAAAHGKAVEEGYVSAFGNDVPARPFMAQTAEQGFPQVVEEYRKALVRALL